MEYAGEIFWVPALPNFSATLTARRGAGHDVAVPPGKFQAEFVSYNWFGAAMASEPITLLEACRSICYSLPLSRLRLLGRTYWVMLGRECSFNRR